MPVTGLTILLLIIVLWAFGVSWGTFFLSILAAMFVVPFLERLIRGDNRRYVRT